MYKFLYVDKNFEYKLKTFRELGKEDEDDDDIMMGDDDGEGGEEGEVPPAEPVKVSVSEQKIQEERTNMLIAHFLFSLVWSVGAVLDGPSRLKFDEFFRTLCEMEGQKAKYPR